MTAVAAAAGPAEPHWTRLHTTGVALLVPTIGVAGVAFPRMAGAGAGWGRLVGWLAILGLLSLLVAVIGHGVTGQVARGVFIDDRNRVSISRLQVGIWGAFVFSGYLAAVLANATLHLRDPLLVAVPQTLWVAMGVSTASFAAAPFVSHQRKRAGAKLARNSKPTDARWRDVVTGEEQGTAKTVDIAKLQMVTATVTLVLAYGIVLAYAFWDAHGRFDSLPKVNDAFAILLAISHGGYLAQQGAPKAGDPVKTRA